VFEELHFGVGLEVLLLKQLLDARYARLVIADFAEDRSRLFGMEPVESRSPTVVAGAVHRVTIAGNLPTANVLRSGSQPEHVGGFRREPVKPVRHSLSIEQLEGILDVLEDYFP